MNIDSIAIFAIIFAMFVIKAGLIVLFCKTFPFILKHIKEKFWWVACLVVALVFGITSAGTTLGTVYALIYLNVL